MTNNSVFAPRIASSFRQKCLIARIATATPLVFIRNALFTTKTMTDTKEAKEMCRAKLNKISTLGDNWNGYGAKPFPKELLQEAERMTEYLIKTPQIYPTADNTIQFEYDKKDGSYLEFQLSLADNIELLEIDSAGNEKEYIIEKSIRAINKAVEAFYGY